MQHPCRGSRVQRRRTSATRVKGEFWEKFQDESIKLSTDRFRRRVQLIDATHALNLSTSDLEKANEAT